MKLTEATPRSPELAECGFYHTVELPSYGLQEGHWDLRGRFDEYTGGVELDGRSLLDVGTATGYLSFEAELRGAIVTSFDVANVDQVRYLPMRNADYVYAHDVWRARTAKNIERMKNGYWLSHRDLGSRARCFYGDVYDLGPALGEFDVVVVGQLLIHLRDGVAALAAAASVCRDTIVIVEGSIDDDSPVALLAARHDRPEVAYAWYQYSHGWYRQVLAMLGFTSVTITSGVYRCNQEDHADQITLTTIVASRDAVMRG